MIRTTALILTASAIGSAMAFSSLSDTFAHAQERIELPGADSTAVKCAALRGMKVDSGMVQDAVSFRAGEAIVGGITAGSKAAVALCRVRLLLQPVAGSSIKVEVWLPQRWNNRLMGFGGGGFDGSLIPTSAQFLNPAVAQGYAAVATDVGHTPAPSPGAWSHDQPERVVDFGHRGVHLAAVTAKQVVRAFYRKTQNKALFQGCSNGGRDAMMLVSRYPADYDAVIAGAPALRYTEVVTQLAWYSRASASAPKLSTKLGLVHRAVLQQCDAIDGVSDGVLEDPRRCGFDPAVLQCKAGDGADCLSAAELTALRKIYDGPRLSDGTRIIHGPAVGGESVPDSWSSWITGPVPIIASGEFYRWMVHDDAAWKVGSFDLDRDYALARRRIAPIINADNPDIRPFVRRGGKLIIYQGWDDPVITPDSTIAHVEAMRARVGGARFDRHVRLFMVPGMAHCGGGPGATSFEMQPELEQWIASGKAPWRVVASKRDLAPSASPLTHPLCAWPMTARYRGAGSVREAANYTCAAPEANR